MASQHPFLKDIWLDIAKHLYTYGPTERGALRYELSLSNRQLKLHSKLMKMRNLLFISGGTFCLTVEGAARVQHTMGLVQRADQPQLESLEERF